MLSHTGSQSKQARSRPSRRQPAAGRWDLVVLAGALVLLLVAFVAASVFAVLYYGDWILPGVRVLDVELGGKTRAEAAALLQRNWQSHEVALTTDDVALSASPLDLGLALDAGATTQIAYEQGRSAGRWSALLRGRYQVHVRPVIVADQRAMDAYLASVRPAIDTPPVDARVYIEQGRVHAVAPEPGRALDVGATVRRLTEHGAQVVLDGRVELATAPVPPSIVDLAALREQASQWLGNVLSIHTFDPVADETLVWQVGPDLWAPWISASTDPTAFGGLTWQIDHAQVSAYLTSQAGALSEGRYLDLETAVAAVEGAVADGTWRARLRVYHRDRQHTVQFGETVSSIARDYGIPYPWILRHNPGVGDSLRVGQVIAIPSPDALLPLPIVQGKRIVVSLSQQAMGVYENGAQLWAWPVSTGIASSPTSPGVFQVQSHDANAYAASWDLWMPYFLGIYRPVPTASFMNGFHGFPTRAGTELLWTGSLGHPVTFGCILLSTQNAAVLYEWAEEGVIVEIRP